MATASLVKTQFNLSINPSNLTCSIITPINNLSFNRRGRKLTNLPLRCSLKPNTETGKSLSTVLQNNPDSFYDAVTTELTRLNYDRDLAFKRFRVCRDSPEVELHRRIAELKNAECEISVEDVLYMIISYRFSEIRVPLVPTLSKCLYNGRLEILPSKDFELESIHSEEILELIKEHLSIVLGWKAGSNVSANWSTTKVQRHHLNQVYIGSLLFGYFLKSASLRLRLEDNLVRMPPREFVSHNFENVVFGQLLSSGGGGGGGGGFTTVKNKDGKLRCYVTGLDMETRNLYSEVKSQEGVKLIEKHCDALFGNKNDVIMTSLASMKRLVLEGVAFGCFLWDAEQFVGDIYKLKDN